MNVDVQAFVLVAAVFGWEARTADPTGAGVFLVGGDVVGAPAVGELYDGEGESA